MPTNTASIESDVRTLERQYWDAVQQSDAHKVERLTSDDFTFVMGEGVNTFRAHDFAEMIAGPGFTLKSYNLDERNAQFRQLAPTVGMLSYPVTMEYERDGTPGVARSYNTSTWIREGKDWKCAVITESPAAPPGR